MGARLPRRESGHLSTDSYLPALDGLRALAVVSVFGYHLGFRWTPGGFLGVDVFFVLSGYLITGILLRERMGSGRTDLARFWTRRARRLFPALTLMVVVVAALVHWLLPVTEWARKEADLLWTIFYGANWHQIASDQDYFATWASASPLLHMWSLGIEEQFYVVWPLVILVLVRRRPNPWVAALFAAAAVISAVLMRHFYWVDGASRAYYGTDARAQELLVGAALAVVALWRPALLGARRLWAVVGVGALIGVAVAIRLFSDSNFLYYQGGALAFSALAAALIAAVVGAPSGPAAVLLSLAPVRWLGRVSYGLYLWHWPAIVFVPLLAPGLLGSAGIAIATNGRALNVARVVAALAMTLVSYYCLEQPIRSGWLARRLSTARIALGTPAAAAAAVAAVLVLTAIPSGAVTIAQPDPSKCAAVDPSCVLYQADKSRPTMVLLGDSTAHSLDPGFVKLSQDRDWTFVDASHEGCSFLQHWVARFQTVVKANWQFCYDMAPRAQDAAVASHPAVIIAMDRWLLVTSLDDNGQLLVAGTPAHERDVETRLREAAVRLTAGGARLVLIHNLPFGLPIECAQQPPPAAYAVACAYRPSDDPLTPEYNAVIDQVASELPGRVTTIDLASAVCPGGACVPVIDGVVLRQDQVHFTKEGALWLEPVLWSRLRAAGIGANG